MTIYAVTSGEYSDYRIEGVFSTKEKAEAFALLVCEANDIEEYVLDSRVDEVEGAIWCCDIALATGDSLRSPWANIKRLRSPRYALAETQKWGSAPELVHAESAVSEEHVVKIAAEFRQKVLRERSL